ncbi:MAG: hypothetical protein JWQ95_1959 [Sphaerisporangium sp.]|jgi:hypothetical protein|nr:hypothetical protein [Sphaerisporangium sp.]
MTNGRAELSAGQERQLRECYATLLDLAGSCEVPAVNAAARMAVAELHAALEGQALAFDYYSHRWIGAPVAENGREPE